MQSLVFAEIGGHTARMRITSLLTVAAALFVSACDAPDKPVYELGCRAVTHASKAFTVCSFDGAEAMQLFLTHPDGQPHGHFDRLKVHVETSGKTLAFAMNAGMYHEDRRAVGLYLEQGEEIAPVVTRAGPGNFGMLPNGVFYRGSAGKYGVAETNRYLKTITVPRFATQSGPLLVDQGQLHPKINPDGTSRKRRNGVGVSADRYVVHFALSEEPVTFHEFATLFRDTLDVPNALYLDGSVSRLYAPEIERNDPGLEMGPIIAVIR